MTETKQLCTIYLHVYTHIDMCVYFPDSSFVIHFLHSFKNLKYRFFFFPLGLKFSPVKPSSEKITYGNFVRLISIFQINESFK